MWRRSTRSVEFSYLRRCQKRSLNRRYGSLPIQSSLAGWGAGGECWPNAISRSIRWCGHTNPFTGICSMNSGTASLGSLVAQKTDFTIARVIARLNIGGPAVQAILMTDAFRRRGYRTLLITGEVPSTEGSMEHLAHGL